LKILDSLKVVGEIISDTFKRKSDNSPAAFKNDMSPISETGDFNDLETKPESYGMENHVNTKHLSDFITITATDTLMSNAETNAKNYVDSNNSEIQLDIDSITDEANIVDRDVNNLDGDIENTNILIWDLIMESDINEEVFEDEAGYWYDPSTGDYTVDT
jgi:hypothetical protein